MPILASTACANWFSIFIDIRNNVDLRATIYAKTEGVEIDVGFTKQAREIYLLLWCQLLIS